MLDISKQYVTDENQNPLAVQIPIATFQQIEEILENFGLVKLMEEVEDDERLTGEEALDYYKSLKQTES
jgi:RelB Antitoxin alpha helical domain